MTTLSTPAGRAEHTTLRPVPWRRMGWVTWRQHRGALIGVAAFLGALAVWLWAAGRRLHDAHAAALACHPANAIACGDLVSSFNTTNKILWYGYVLQAVPALLGAFVGAPVVAREFETGTFRYTWTQSFGRWRWALGKLVALAVTVTLAAGVFSAVVSWYYQPYFDARNDARSLTGWSPLDAGVFVLRGVGLAAWTLVAFAIGALAGALIRRVLPAVVAALIGYTGLALVVDSYVRPHYAAALTTREVTLASSAMITRQWWTHGRQFAFNGRPSMDLLLRLCPPGVVGPGKPSTGDIAQCLGRHGYTQWTSYQPASRFWTFQWIEAGWLVALSAVLVAATVGVVRRRGV